MCVCAVCACVHVGVTLVMGVLVINEGVPRVPFKNDHTVV